MISSSTLGGTEKEQAHRQNILDAICVAVLIAYFFALPALRGGFRGDEMMNMGIWWCAGALKSLLANIVFWKLFLCPGDALYDLPLYLYRPGGALYYLPLYHFFGLDPLPYRIVQISILAASIPLVYYLSRRLACSRSSPFSLSLLFVTTRDWPASCSSVRSFMTCYVDSFTSLHWLTTSMSARKTFLFDPGNFWDF
jgi:hypothetical protein